MFSVAKADDTVYEDITPHDEDDDRATMLWNEQVPSVQEEEKEYRVIRRRSRSVGSRPFLNHKPESPPASNSEKYGITQKIFTQTTTFHYFILQPQYF